MAIIKDTWKKIDTVGGILPGGFGTIKEEESTEKKNCEAKGGRWDEVNQKCILPEAPKTTASTPTTSSRPTITEPTTEPITEPRELNPQKTEKITDKEGNVIGATIPDGRTFLGLNERDVEKLAEQQREKQAKEALLFQPEGTARAVSKEQQQQGIEELEQQQQGIQGLEMGLQAGQIDEQSLLDEAEIADVNYAKAFFKAVPDMLPDVATAIGGGIVAGSAGWTGIGGIGGLAALGAGVRGAYSDIKSEVEGQKREFTGAQEQILEEGKQVLNDITGARNAGAKSSSESAALWQEQLSTIKQAYYNLQRQQIDSRYIGEDLTKEIIEFETYFNFEYVVQYDEFLLAMQQPDISKVNPSDKMRKKIIDNINSNLKV